jgi:UDP-N-acetylglucosamine 2-epimerase (non-hydrolysing)
MKNEPLLYFVVGTRPEAIKLCPVIQCAKAMGAFKVRVCATGQHKELASQVLDWFGISPDIDLDVMREGQTLSSLLARLIGAISLDVQGCDPAFVIVQGDTSSALAGAMVAFNSGRKLGHVEAGLRTHDLSLPWPEEFNRRVISLAASLHFAPTARAAENLVVEGISKSVVEVTGNTVIDGLRASITRARSRPPTSSTLVGVSGHVASGRPLVLVTAHRRESRGAAMASLCAAIADVAQQCDVDILWPIHPNPEIRVTIEKTLVGRRNVHVVPPLDYARFVELLDRASVVITDSGGVQEEAAALHKPLVIVRDVTERPEVLALKTTRLVGTDRQRIVAATVELLSFDSDSLVPVIDESAFGDGHASERIIARLCRELSTDVL